jgi:hypothetical protein
MYFVQSTAAEEHDGGNGERAPAADRVVVLAPKQASRPAGTNAEQQQRHSSFLLNALQRKAAAQGVGGGARG